MLRFAFRSLTCTVIAVALLSPAARAESPGDLIAKNLAARGGADKLAAIRSIQFAGKVVEPGGFELGYLETRRRKNEAVLYQQTVQGLTLIQGFDGKTGWRVNPFEGRRDAERLSPDAAAALADDGSIDGPLLSAKGGGTVAYVGREDYEGTDTFKLRLTTATGTEYTYYLDPDTYLEVRVVETRILRGAKSVQSLEFGDYELVDGVYFPFEIESGAVDSAPQDREKLTIDHATANVVADDAMFAMPVTKAAK